MTHLEQLILDETRDADSSGRRGRAKASAAAASEPVPLVTSRPEPLPYDVGQHPQDYVSVGTYWWPNPDTSDGRPLVHRDGEFSPLIDRYDRPRLDQVFDTIHLHLLVALGTDDPQPAEAAAAVIVGNFIEPTTRLNPNLKHTQHVPGVDTGRLVGVIDVSIRMPAVLDVYRLSRHLLPADVTRGFEGWGGQLLDWLLEEDVRTWHESAKNNLGVYYDLLAESLARTVGRVDVAAERLRFCLGVRLPQQVDDDGGLPHELKRTRSFDYTTMTIWGFVRAADAAVELDVADWASLLDANAPLRRCVDYVYDHLAAGPWPHDQIGQVEVRNFGPALALINASAGAPLFATDAISGLADAKEALLKVGAHPWHPPQLSGAVLAALREA
ncbi:MAG: alginate lyase family protein [Planctomycetota bacterium]